LNPVPVAKGTGPLQIWVQVLWDPWGTKPMHKYTTGSTMLLTSYIIIQYILYVRPKVERIHYLVTKKHEKKKKRHTTGPNDVLFGPIFGCCCCWHCQVTCKYRHKYK
jgi:hypothetical protein